MCHPILSYIHTIACDTVGLKVLQGSIYSPKHGQETAHHVAGTPIFLAWLLPYLVVYILASIGAPYSVAVFYILALAQIESAVSLIFDLEIHKLCGFSMSSSKSKFM